MKLRLPHMPEWLTQDPSLNYDDPNQLTLEAYQNSGRPLLGALVMMVPVQPSAPPQEELPHDQ